MSDCRVYQGQISDPEHFPDANVFLEALHIPEGTVAILVNDDPQMISNSELEGFVHSLAQIKHPRLPPGTPILVGRDLGAALETISEREMNELGWFRAIYDDDGRPLLREVVP